MPSDFKSYHAILCTTWSFYCHFFVLVIAKMCFFLKEDCLKENSGR
uniref:Uncharacterized protein n=1 Tax=Rhizophora mucronata TaxID=61149 RepID=A0A2P2PRA2_RHIMU